MRACTQFGDRNREQIGVISLSCDFVVLCIPPFVSLAADSPLQHLLESAPTATCSKEYGWFASHCVRDAQAELKKKLFDGSSSSSVNEAAGEGSTSEQTTLVAEYVSFLSGIHYCILFSIGVFSIMSLFLPRFYASLFVFVACLLFLFFFCVSSRTRQSDQRHHHNQLFGDQSGQSQVSPAEALWRSWLARPTTNRVPRSLHVNPASVSAAAAAATVASTAQGLSSSSSSHDLLPLPPLLFPRAREEALRDKSSVQRKRGGADALSPPQVKHARKIVRARDTEALAAADWGQSEQDRGNNDYEDQRGDEDDDTGLHTRDDSDEDDGGVTSLYDQDEGDDAFEVFDDDDDDDDDDDYDYDHDVENEEDKEPFNAGNTVLRGGRRAQHGRDSVIRSHSLSSAYLGALAVAATNEATGAMDATDIDDDFQEEFDE